MGKAAWLGNDHLINGTRNCEHICSEIRQDLSQKTSRWHLWVLLQEESCGLVGPSVHLCFSPLMSDVAD